MGAVLGHVAFDPMDALGVGGFAVCPEVGAPREPDDPAVFFIGLAAAVGRFDIFGDRQSRFVVGFGARVFAVGVQAAFESLVGFVPEVGQGDEGVVVGVVCGCNSK